MPLPSTSAPGQCQTRTHDIGYSDEVEMGNHSSSTTRPSKDNGEIREKLTAIADVNTEDTLEDQDAALLLSKSTPADAANMRRMGKPQQLIRHFRFLSTVSFVALATAAWEIGLFVLTPGLPLVDERGCVGRLILADGKYGAYRRRTVSLGMRSVTSL
ncbi:hypothetical protein LTR74_003187 [Friedmanniomyces endolithicus]|nr:hypothetical protein LTR74_003187 [Friedmanniomyces endolithicus]